MKYLLLTICTIFLVSCSKDLDLAPKEDISDPTFWKTAADFKLAANNLYNSLEGFGFEDTETDLAFNNPNAISNGTYQPTETVALWTNSYVFIRRANIIISKESEVKDEGALRFIGEARFFRAYNYWRLYRLYGGLPLIESVYEPTDKELFVPRSSREEIAKFIINDLEQAIQNLPNQTQLSSGDKGRITKGTALALLARVALFEGTWQKYHSGNEQEYFLTLAREKSLEIINSNQYTLYSAKGINSYRYLFIEEGDDSPESILDRRYERNIQGHSVPYLIDRIGYLPTKKLADMYLSSDGLPITQSPLFEGYDSFTSEFMNRDPRMTMTMVVPGSNTKRAFFPNGVATWPDNPQRIPNTGYIAYKYISEDAFGNGSGETGNSHGFDKHIIRYAEVLLIFAESTFELQGSITDNDLDISINKLRSRVGMPAITNEFVTSNQLDMKSEIRRERTVELALEGFRYDDLRRWKLAEVEMKKDIKGIKVKDSEWASRPPYSGPSWQSRTDENGFLIAEPSSNRFFEPNKHYLRPLPTREVAFYLANGFELTQNSGW